MMSMFRLFTDLTSLLFPRLCGACNMVLTKGEKEVCTHCIYHLPYTDFHLDADNLLMKQFWGRVPVHTAMALLYFQKSGKTQNLIHQLKYKGRKSIGIFLGIKIGERLLLSEAYQEIDFIVPVPLHYKKELSRGYNQSKLIAEGISKVIHVPVLNKVLTRKKPTGSQTRKDRYERSENLLQVFDTNRKYNISDKHILLVDDVVTTGATLEMCGIALHKQHIKKLSIAAAAYVK